MVNHRGLDDLPTINQTLAGRLAAIEDSSGMLGKLGETAQKWQKYYLDMSSQLDASRKKAAIKLDQAVLAELPDESSIAASLPANV